MKRYDLIHYCPYPGGGESELAEDADGEWVRHDEARAEIARLQHALSQAVDANMATANRLHAMIRVLRADSLNA